MEEGQSDIEAFMRVVSLIIGMNRNQGGSRLLLGRQGRLSA